MPLEQLTFTIPEIFSLVGLAQCVYVLVYMLFRSGDPSRAAIPFLYFLVLGCAFFFDFAARYIGETIDIYFIIQWALWFYGPPISVLLLIQVAQINEMPSWGSYWVLLLVPMAFCVSYALADTSLACQGRGIHCETFKDWLALTGLLAGVVSMLAIYSLRHILEDLYKEKEGKSRYWLVLTLVIINLMFLITMLLSMTPYIDQEEALMVKTILGITFVYLAGTSLFRIYPQALILVSRSEKNMSEDEQEIAAQIESLLLLEKIYHEAAYSRKDLARELGLSEAIVSRVINVHFNKSLPQLLNEKRVEDAQRMLLETKESVKTISDEVGFNSLATFNRVFREIAGVAPSEYRENPPDSANDDEKEQSVQAEKSEQKF